MMQKMIQNHGVKLFLAGFAAGVLTLALLAFNNRQGERALSTRQIVLVSTDVEFYLEGKPEDPNPTLKLKVGQPVNLVIRNEEPGKVLHCFNTGDLGVKTTGTLATGESEMLHFTPKKRGTFVYACLLHANMVGKIVVE
jgi:plastocyanin